MDPVTGSGSPSTVTEGLLMLIALPPETEARLRAKAAREGRDVESVVNALLASGLDLEVAGGAPVDPSSRPPTQANGAPTPIGELGLIQRINEGPAPETWQRYHALVERRRDELLSPDEYAELLELTHQVELANARRLEYLAELARLRRTGLREVMQQLEIQAPPNA
jgi:hypothetical protein